AKEVKVEVDDLKQKEDIKKLDDGIKQAKKDISKIDEGISKADYFKIIKEATAEETNKWWKDVMEYDPPYTPGTVTKEIELVSNKKFVRVYDGTNSKMYGGWVMDADDIAGLTPLEIQDKYALPFTPKYICDVDIEAGTILRTGEANPLFGYKGGGTQFDLMGQYVGKFSNERLIGGK
ncbi:MAG: hypothetical protein ACI33I_09020, partial [Clostridium sp.]